MTHYEVATAYIRARDVARLHAQVGLTVPHGMTSTIAELGAALDQHAADSRRPQTR
ncbi:hypothetical protein [Cryptosporangium sp. NPDC051539]|uniref:hypothetical protein n=1 Tax=Cryptosporangium sp. NPDC051539 TaxID=3363962 RepID=UPI00378DCB48